MENDNRRQANSAQKQCQSGAQLGSAPNNSRAGVNFCQGISALLCIDSTRMVPAAYDVLARAISESGGATNQKNVSERLLRKLT